MSWVHGKLAELRDPGRRGNAKGAVNRSRLPNRRSFNHPLQADNSGDTKPENHPSAEGILSYLKHPLSPRNLRVIDVLESILSNANPLTADYADLADTTEITCNRPLNPSNLRLIDV